MSKIVNLVEQIATGGFNPNLRIGGIVMTMYGSRTNLSQQVVAEVRQHFLPLLYQTLIPRTIRLGEAPSFGKTILEYDSAGAGAVSYRRLAAEFIRRQRGEPEPVENNAPAADSVPTEPAARPLPPMLQVARRLG